MGRPPPSGPLDPLVEALGTSALARDLGVTRQSIHRWQKGGPVAAIYRMRMNLLALGLGLPEIFPTGKSASRSKKKES